MRDHASILRDFRETFRIVRKEEASRQELMEGDTYQSLENQIKGCKSSQEMMLKSLPDSREEYEADKQELMDMMEQTGLKKCEEFQAKGRKVRKVDTLAVLHAMEGDIDNLLLVSSVKIKDLETFIKANPEYKKDLKRCIVEGGYKITDIFLADE